MSPRNTLSGIMYVLENGYKWRFLPQIYGKSSTVHGSFMRWIKRGLFEKIMDRTRSFYLSKQSDIRRWCAIDASSCKAPYARWSGKNPTDRGKKGVKKNIIIDWYGAPLALSIGPANRHDSVFFNETLEKLPTFGGSGLGVMAADSAYDAQRYRKSALKRDYVLFACTNARRRSGLRKVKPGSLWKVEASHSWLNNFRGLKTCWRKTREAFFAFLQLGASVVLFRKGLFFG